MKYNYAKQTLKKLKENNILLIDLSIIDEIESQAPTYTEKEKQMLYSHILDAYLHAESLTIEEITNTAIKNIHNLSNLTKWELINKACKNY